MPATAPVVIRPARVDDGPVIGELTAHAYLHDGLIEPGDEYLVELRDGAGRVREAHVLVAECDGAIAGAITIAPHGNPWAEMAEPGEVELRMLAVHPEYRRRGIARTLAQAAIEAGRELGGESIILCSMDTMVPAHSMYDRLGFTRVPERDWGVPRVHLIAYRLPLATADPLSEPAAVHSAQLAAE